MVTQEVRPKREEISAGQLWGTVALVLLILGAFLGAVFLYRQQQQLDQLAHRVTQLSASLPPSGSNSNSGTVPLRRLAYVNTSKVAASYLQLDQQLQQQLQAKQNDLQKQLDALKQQLKDQKISQEDYNVKLLGIQQSLNQIQQQALSSVSDKMIAVIEQIGREGNYDLIIGEENVVLYSRSGLMEDLSGEVLARMQAQLSPVH
jgi:Skp family chaperone for outer membrane proteins